MVNAMKKQKDNVQMSKRELERRAWLARLAFGDAFVPPPKQDVDKDHHYYVMP